jgi:transcriptional regulator with XRE-family HTH domain
MKITGVSRETIRLLENDKTNPTEDTLKKLAKGLKLEIEDLL